EAWEEMSGAILKAAKGKVNPFTTPLFEPGHDMAREQAFLSQDQEVYRLDVRRGERWMVTLPTEPPTRAAALFLRQPKSILFKEWSRTDKEAPGGRAYQFLVINTGPGAWTITTDPVHRISLKSLAAALQAAEAAGDAGKARDDPWFDG